MLGLSNEGYKCYKMTEIIKQRRNSLKMPVIGAFTLVHIVASQTWQAHKYANKKLFKCFAGLDALCLWLCRGCGAKCVC